MYSLYSQQYYQQAYGAASFNPVMMGVSVPQQMDYDPFVMNQQQSAYYSQLFYTMVGMKCYVDGVGFGPRRFRKSTRSSWLFHAEWFAAGSP